MSLPIVLTNIDSTIKEGRYVNLRGMKAKWEHQDLIPGISGDNYLATNKYGLKGPLFGNEEYRVLVIGNSLVEGALLDNSEVWTARLQRELSKKGLSVKVFNAGKSGAISAQRFIDVYEAYKKYRFDLVILYPLASINPKYKPTEGFGEFYVPDFKNKELSLRNNSIVQILRSRKWEFASYVKKRFGFKLFRNAIVDPNHVKAIFTQAKQRHRLPSYSMKEEYLKEYELNYKNGVELIKDYFQQEDMPILSFDRLHQGIKAQSDADMALWWGNLIDNKKIKLEDYKLILDTEFKVNKLYSSKLFNIVPHSELVFEKSWLYDQEHFSEDGSERLAKALVPHVLNLLPKK